MCVCAIFTPNKDVHLFMYLFVCVLVHFFVYLLTYILCTYLNSRISFWPFQVGWNFLPEDLAAGCQACPARTWGYHLVVNHGWNIPYKWRSPAGKVMFSYSDPHQSLFNEKRVWITQFHKVWIEVWIGGYGPCVGPGPWSISCGLQSFQSKFIEHVS